MIVTGSHISPHSLCPKELQVLAGGKKGVPVNINVEDKRSEDYVAPPKPAYIAFSGEGHTLSRYYDGLMPLNRLEVIIFSW